MTLSHSEHARIDAQMHALQAKGVPFAMATIVRTVNATSAKPGGKALLDRDGQIIAGWVGGGCARGAVGKAARLAIATGDPQLISLRPQELLDAEGLNPGDTRDGVSFARNGCPSKGTMDVFIEPVLPLPELVICGNGQVAMALADLGARFDFKVTLRTAPGSDANPSPAYVLAEGFAFDTPGYVVVATQGRGDMDALRAAVSITPAYVAFVGSAVKFATLRAKMMTEDAALAPALARVHAPAGIDIKAITPEEIALSILAQITLIRRSGQTDRIIAPQTVETAT